MSGLLPALKAVCWRVLTRAVKPPGLYVLAAVAVFLAFWGYGHHEYHSGQAACEAAHTATTQAAIVRQERRNTAAVETSEARTAADTKIVYRNKEIIRYVTRAAAKLPDGGDVCIAPDIADRLRSLD